MMEISGIQCDNINCNYENEDVQVGEYEQWLNKPCPKCGSNLLTEADFRTVRIMMVICNNPIIKVINAIANKLRPGSVKSFKGEMNGTGKIDLKEINDR